MSASASSSSSSPGSFNRVDVVTNRLKAFSETFGYHINENKYCRHVVPKSGAHIKPEEDTEVFVTGLPVETLEDEIYQVFSSVGKICEITLMVTKSGMYNKEHAIVQFYQQNDAVQAVMKFNHFKIRSGWALRVSKFSENNKLFLRGIDFQKNHCEVYAELQAMGVQGVKHVDVLERRNPGKSNQNSGMACVHFINHKAARFTKSKFGSNLSLFHRKVTMDWSFHYQEVPQDVQQQVKCVLIRNLNLNVTRLDVMRILYRLVPLGQVVRVFRKCTFCFIHFTERRFAEMAMNNLKYHFKSSGQHSVEVLWDNKPPLMENSAK